MHSQDVLLYFDRKSHSKKNKCILKMFSMLLVIHNMFTCKVDQSDMGDYLTIFFVSSSFKHVLV